MSGNWICVFSVLIIFFMVMLFCYCDFGLSLINDFIMVSGVGFVVVLVFFILLNIWVILGIVVISLLVCCSNLCVLLMEMSGLVFGIYIKFFLLSVGINLLFILLRGYIMEISNISVIKSVFLGWFNICVSNGK